MSFEIYVQSFNDGDASSIYRQRIRSAFGEYLSEVEPDFWQLRYDDWNSCDLYLDPLEEDPGCIVGFTVSRPCADERLWDALAFLLGDGNLVVYFPGCRGPLMASEDVARHLPVDMLQSLGPAVIVASGAEIQIEIAEC